MVSFWRFSSFPILYDDVKRILNKFCDCKLFFTIYTPIEHFLQWNQMQFSSFCLLSCFNLLLLKKRMHLSRKGKKTISELWIMILTWHTHSYYSAYGFWVLSQQRHKRLMSPLNWLQKPHHTDLMVTGNFTWKRLQCKLSHLNNVLRVALWLWRK